MTLPSKAIFVRSPFRYQTASDTAVKTTYQGAGEIQVDTFLDEAAAAAMATKILNVVKLFAEAYEVTVEGCASPNDLAGGVPTFTLSHPKYGTDGRTFKTTSMTIDRTENTTTYVIRG